MQSSLSPPPTHRVGHSITFNPGGGAGGGGAGAGDDDDPYHRLNRRRSTTTTVTTTGVDSSSDHEQHQHHEQQQSHSKPLQHHPLADIRPSSRRFLGADEYYCNDDDTSGGVEYAVMVPDSFAVI